MITEIIVLTCTLILGVGLITFFSIILITEIKEFREDKKLFKDKE